MENIKENISFINEKIKRNATIIAVSKKKSAELIKEAFESGVENFGENYLQEAIEKISFLKHLKINWHFIGKIQSNKCKEIAKNFEWVHTVDRFKIAKLLNDNCPLNKTINVLIQINIDKEESKSGINDEEILSLAEGISSLPNLKLKGVMVIPKNESDKKLTEISFEKTVKASMRLRDKFPHANEVSMGMSNDFELAIKKGSTMIRIGTGIFGERH
ncbi:MAG: YggS family pyridoxal phosphate enzyme [Gammaproteobacteria bacterium TMED222]|nr:YggS family pyridoxal phosphate-dependent enzyme [Gammaproteobacteria bacterium]OUW81462.1 MAG: YggS family pyridoxal phosphate enzyme [Gammaproteobacteria bacterium TMED222]